MTRVTKSSKAARPARHHVGEKAGAVKSFDGLVVQEGDRFIGALQSAASASKAMLDAALEVASAASLQFGADIAEADRFVATWQRYVRDSAGFASGIAADPTLKSNLARAARLIKALVTGDVLPENVPTDRGLRAASDACPKRTTGGRKAKVEEIPAEGSGAPVERAQSQPDVGIMSAVAALVAALKTAPDGHSLVELIRTAPMACVAAIRDLRDGLEAAEDADAVEGEAIV
jgi:hypothetical protein